MREEAAGGARRPDTGITPALAGTCIGHAICPNLLRHCPGRQSVKVPEVVTVLERSVSCVIKFGVGALCVCSPFVPIGAGAQPSEAWEFEASLYGYFPTITGTTTFPPQSGADEVSVDAGRILENLKFAFTGSFEARRGPWGAYTDLLYMDVGDTKTQARAITIGGTQLPANASASVEFDLKTTGWELAGS
jgi:hypothetical protein